jgi:choline-sulfatase
MPELPNILLIVVDALRPDHLGCYGYGRETSPELDRIAAQGVRFERVIAQSSWTKPSVSSLLTSTLPEVHQVKDVHDVLAAPEHYLPLLLRSHGYVTGCIQTNPFLSSASGFAQGFDYYLELFDKDPGVSKPRGDYATDVVLEWLERMRDDRFFLYLHLLDTHNPYLPPDQFRVFGPCEKDLFDGEIRFVDHHLQVISDFLLRSGLEEKTLLLITSDHGEEFQEHGASYHAKHVYEEVVRVPLIVSAPTLLPAGVVIPTQVRSIDIVPTILDLLGIAPDAAHQGESLLPLLSSPSLSHRPAISQCGEKDSPMGGEEVVSLSEGDYKLIWKRKEDRCELYHLPSDPGEVRDLAPQEEDKTTQAKAALEQQLRSPVNPEDKSPRPRSKSPRKAEFDSDILARLRGLGYLD